MDDAAFTCELFHRSFLQLNSYKTTLNEEIHAFIEYHLFCQCVVCTIESPVSSENHPGNKGNIYAVVIGISNYESSGIDQLEFAHKDAEVFAGFLKSASGGAVPEENIRVLLNEKATFSAIYDALYWLRRSCSKDDLVYFYFSGHGDTEDQVFINLDSCFPIIHPDPILSIMQFGLKT